ncbi:MAG TPA: UDP-4-amino-4,6-dideoxy-N-acetyl-beta-L-altrosamine transaminase [Bacteroidetes bacterium]|nr:UDP-4-amino-4,6-dideoxy-N-acetyl-beta-L-altrosamine transaminase [Bacteroidota bacterium]
MKIPYGRQHITDEDIAAVSEVLSADFLTQGPRIAEFEAAFAQYVGAQYAVAVSNGTAALHLCALALDVGPGSKAITTPITFAASANCIAYCGGEVAFADIDPETFLLDPAKVRTMLEAAPAGTYQGIIPVDFAGYPADLPAFRKLADEFGLWIIEDACHAPGGYTLENDAIKFRCGDGQLAELAIFSFHPVKHIACGEGGMITTNDPAHYHKLCRLRTHGITKDPALLTENHGGWYYDMVDLGYNYRLTDIQAILGTKQLQKQPKWMERRQAIARKYDAAFAGTAVQIPKRAENIFHAFHLYVIQIDNRKGLFDHLRSKGIFAQVHYIPTHTLAYYRKKDRSSESLPLAEAYYARCLSLPMFPTLTEAEQDFVIEQVRAFSGK